MRRQPAGRARREWLSFAIVGALCIIAGGLLAAVTASAPTQNTA